MNRCPLSSMSVLMLLLAAAAVHARFVQAQADPGQPVQARTAQAQAEPQIRRPSGSSGAPVEKAPAEPEPNAIVRQPRSFGYVIGDLATQRVLLELDGKPFVPESLPTIGRAGVWFERRAVRTEKDPAGRNWLVVDYQLMNAPQALAVATMPAWKLKSADGSAELRVPAWRVTVSPISAEEPIAQAGLGTLRPDHRAQPIDLAPRRTAFAMSLGGMFATMLAWAGWLLYRNWRASAERPFAIALREMRHRSDTEPQAWHALHRAFDRTAGRVVRTETIADLFRRAPWLQPLREDIERFYTQSAARFFGGAEPEQPVAVHALCRELRRVEKRHER